MKKTVFGIFLLLMALESFGQVRVELKPLDFQDEDIAETLMQHVYQLETAGDRIFIRSENNYLTQIDRNGAFLGKIGPVDFGSPQFQRIGGMAVAGERVAVMNRKKTVFVYEGDALTHHFTPENFQAVQTFLHLNANMPGFDGSKIVLSDLVSSGKAATVHSIKGEPLARVADAAAFSRNLEAAHTAIGASHWVKDGKYWYCLFKFKPFLRKYDENFNLLTQFQLSHETIARAEERLYDPNNPMLGGKGLLPPHFSDFKIFQGRLFAMCGNTLLEFSGSDGAVVGEWVFYGTGTDFEGVDPWRPLTLPAFAFLSDGTLVLSHPNLLWNHDLWTADISVRSNTTLPGNPSQP